MLPYKKISEITGIGSSNINETKFIDFTHHEQMNTKVCNLPYNIHQPSYLFKKAKKIFGKQLYDFMKDQNRLIHTRKSTPDQVTMKLGGFLSFKIPTVMHQLWRPRSKTHFF